MEDEFKYWLNYCKTALPSKYKICSPRVDPIESKINIIPY